MHGQQNIKFKTVTRIILWFITQCPQQLRRMENEEGSRCGQVETKRLNLYAGNQDKQQNSTSISAMDGTSKIRNRNF
jgi:hypothetical protein